MTKPERRILDPLGIDIADGLYVKENAYLTIGDPGSGGLSWRFIPGAEPYAGNVVETLSGSNKLATVKFEGSSTVFVNNGSTYLNASGTGATLTKTASTYIFTDDSGTVYTYAWTYNANTTPAPASNAGPLLSIQKPDGTVLTITGGSLNGASPTVVSSQGYALKTVNNSGVITIYAVNLTAHTCDAAINCDAYDASITRQTVANSDAPETFVSEGGVDQITDPNGNNWQYEVSFTTDIVQKNGNESFGAKAIWYYKDPTGYFTKVLYDYTGRITNFTDTRGTYAFDYNGQTTSQAVTDFNRTVTVSTPATPSAIVYSAYAQYKHSTIGWIRDGLGNQTNYNFAMTNVGVTNVGGNNYTRLMSVTKPEGNSVSYIYDARGNVTSTTSTPKSSSGQSSIAVNAGYDSSCGNLKTCNKPNWTRDAKGNQTDYTYDGTHGGVLTVTLPVDQNGLRQRTYNTYTSFDTGNGYIYRLTRTESCGLNAGQLGLTACPATVATSVATTDYGTSTTAPRSYKTFLPLSVTQTDGAGSLSVTTTYTYDNIGNVVIVDGPRTDVDDKTYRTYDPNRRVIFEIGADPDGSSPMRRMTVRHSYDGAGRETKTDTGTCGTVTLVNGLPTTCADFAVSSFTRVTYDTAGRPIKTETVQP